MASFEAFKAAMVAASSQEQVADALNSFANFMKTEPANAASLSKGDIVQVAMSKRKADASLWSKDVALSFRAVIEEYQHASQLATDSKAVASIHPVAIPPPSSAHHAAGAAAAPSLPVSSPSASAAGASAPGSLASCHEVLRPHFKDFTTPDITLATEAVLNALRAIQRDKANRQWSIVGAGADYIIYVVKRALEASDHSDNTADVAAFREASTRLLALCALHDEAETVFFHKGAVELAVEMGKAATNDRVRGHAARLFFNLSFLRTNRPLFLRKGALEHIKRILRDAGDIHSPNSSGRKIALSMSKTLVQLACHPVCIKPLVSHPLFVEIWTKFAQHAFGEIRQRAAVVFNQIVSNGLGQDARFKPTVAILANEVLNGEFEKPPENAKISEAVMLAKMFARTNSTASQETAPLAPLTTPTVHSSCDSKFISQFQQFTNTDVLRCSSAISACLHTLRGHKEYRPDVVKGNGVEMCLYAARRCEPNGPNPNPHALLLAIKLVAEASLHDETEAPTPQIKQQAARLAFNLTYTRTNRPAAIRKGALVHARRMILDESPDTRRSAIVLSTAKMCVQLACHPDCVNQLFQFSSFPEMWEALAKHPSSDVRQRAATVFCKVVPLNIGGVEAHRRSIQPMLDTVLKGPMGRDTSKAAVAAIRMAQTVTADLPDVDVSDCHEFFRTAFRGFYSSEDVVMEGSIDTALSAVQVAKDRRVLACQGSGVKHMLFALRNTKNGSPGQLSAVRLCAEAGLHDATEDLFFQNGAVETAMQITKSTTNAATRPHATRFFFNLSYIRANRPAFLEKGAMEFFDFVLRHFHDTEGRKQMVLHMAKTMVQLVCVPSLVQKIAEHPTFLATWLAFANHDDKLVRARAVKIFNKVIPAKDSHGVMFGKNPKFRPMIDAIMTGACAWLPAANSAKALVREHHLAS